MVEEDTVAAEHVIGFAVFLDDPETVKLGDSIRGVGMEGRLFALWDSFHLAVKLRSGCLINAAGISDAAHAYSLKDAQHTGRIDVGCIFGHIKGYLDMGLCRQVIDFVRHDPPDDRDHAHGIAQIPVMQMEMIHFFQMRDTLTEIHR